MTSGDKNNVADFEAMIFAAEMGAESPTLDIHGLNVENAAWSLEEFINHEFMQGSRVIKIIHGRGKEKLKNLVEELLKHHQIIDYYRSTQDPKHLGAITYAIITKNT